jgi:GNAT superfamily N-acetyltransferase
VAATVLTSAAEVLVATGHDPYVRSTLRRTDITGWIGHGAVCWRAIDGEERLPYVMTLGEPAQVALLVEELLPELSHRTRLTVPRGTLPLLPAWVSMDPTHWDFWWYDAPPAPRPGALPVVDVSDAEVEAVLLDWSPTASSPPGDPGVRRWFGIRDGGRLVACAADTTGATGVGHLSSIATDPARRGQGLGWAVTAGASRVLFGEGCDLVTLGMYASNDAGRALYTSLGMRSQPFTSGQLQVRSRW